MRYFIGPMADFWKNLFGGSKDGTSAGGRAWQVRHEDGVTIITAVAKPEIEESLQLIRDLNESGLYRRRIYDVSRIEFPFTIEELKGLAIAGREIITERNRLAIVVKDDVGYGSVRAFLAHRESASTAGLNVFRSLEEARDWITGDED